jgi:hypothetical protein
MDFELNKAKQILARTPATLNALLHGLSDEWIFSNEVLIPGALLMWWDI